MRIFLVKSKNTTTYPPKYIQFNKIWKGARACNARALCFDSSPMARFFSASISGSVLDQESVMMSDLTDIWFPCRMARQGRGYYIHEVVFNIVRVHPNLNSCTNVTRMFVLSSKEVLRLHKPSTKKHYKRLRLVYIYWYVRETSSWVRFWIRIRATIRMM